MLLAVLLTAHFVWAGLDAWRHNEYTVWSQNRTHALILVACIYGAALLALLPAVRARARVVSVFLICLALLFTARFHLVRSLLAEEGRRVAARHALPSETATRLIAFLREVSAAQEQYRLRQHAYAAAIDSLAEWMAPPVAGSKYEVTRRGDAGWSARASLGDVACSVWARDTTLRSEAWEIEGVPSCGKTARERHRQVRSVLAPPPPRLIAFGAEDVRGTWLQHRADSGRSGSASAAGMTPGAYRWTTKIGGEMLASVAIAGNQVFAGAHGNGELVALSLDSGLVGFRLRVPNWIHHEPAITEDLAIVAFGNNELRAKPPPRMGTEPSGIAAYDRRTGLERWRRYEPASMMLGPVVLDTIVANVVATRDAVGWRVSDGRELWRTTLPADSPMGNPLLADSTMFIGLERGMLCALDVRTGARRFCQAVHGAKWGGGHASVASAGSTVLLVFSQALSLEEMVEARRWRFALANILRLPGTYPALEEQVLIGLDRANGRELWRVRLGPGLYEHSGHVAGTPTVVGDIAYVPSPISGRVFAVDAKMGKALWSVDVNTVRGSVLVTRGAVLAATTDTTLVVLDATSGAVRCTQRLPGFSDRAGPTLAGETAVMTFRNGIIAARPIADWLACRA